LILRIAHYRFVVVDLPEREFEQIKTGETAAVRLIGSDDWKQGKIRANPWGPQPEQMTDCSPHRSSVRCLAALPWRSNCFRKDPTRSAIAFCNIGRMAEVRFQRTGFGFADRFLSRLAGMFRDGPQAELKSAAAK
jgi:hypothetical protein